MMTIIPRPMHAVALAAALIAMAPLTALAEPVTLSGEVTYRERVALPDGATLVVRLVDAARADAPATLAAEAGIEGPGQVPLSFTIDFDSDIVDPAGDYRLEAEIRVDGQLAFRNAEALPIDPLAGAVPETILLTMVGTPPQEPDEPDAPEEPAGPEDPVAPEEPVAPEDPAAADPALVGTGWVLEIIGGAPAAAGVTSTLSIGGDGSAGGNGGCNSFGGSAAIEGASISFSQIVSTMMACPEPAMSQERAFFDALEATAAWRIEAGRLVLVDGAGAVVAELSATQG